MMPPCGLKLNIVEKLGVFISLSHFYLTLLEYYKGYINAKGDNKAKTIIQELLNISSTAIDFTEQDIDNRTSQIFDAFCMYLKSEGLTK
jgi:hypothetical protein